MNCGPRHGEIQSSQCPYSRRVVFLPESAALADDPRIAGGRLLLRGPVWCAALLPRAMQSEAKGMTLKRLAAAARFWQLFEGPGRIANIGKWARGPIRG